MPKKHRHQRLYTKPPSTAPSTLASSLFVSGSTRLQAPQPPPAQSVNELLHHLRVSQARHPEPNSVSTPVPVSIGQPRTHHPSVAALIGADTTPTPFLRPRSRIIGSRALPRTTAGPPPPRSWVSGCSRGPDSSISRSFAKGSTSSPGPSRDGAKGICIPRLPGMIKVGKKSLMHYALVSLARNWEWVMVYEKFYLAMLRPGLKALLGGYVIAYNGGISKEGLQVLYPLPEKEKGRRRRRGRESDHESDDGSSEDKGILEGGGTQDLESWEISSDSDCASGDPSNLRGTTHLDLSYSLGTSSHRSKNFLIRSLERFLFSGHLLPPSSDSLSAIDNPPSLPNPPRLHLPSLTHLSLAYPSSLNPFILWAQTTPHNLPYILSHIPTLTHLSLAGWPGPPSHYIPEQKLHAIQRLSSSTYCLKWLDLTGWDGDVMHMIFIKQGFWEGPWGGYWRGVETLVWSCGDRDNGETGEDWTLEKKNWERVALMKRREADGGGGWVRLRIVAEEKEGEEEEEEEDSSFDE